jgi:hypothetical protein
MDTSMFVLYMFYILAESFKYLMLWLASSLATCFSSSMLFAYLVNYLQTCFSSSILFACWSIACLQTGCGWGSREMFCLSQVLNSEYFDN